MCYLNATQELQKRLHKQSDSDVKWLLLLAITFGKLLMLYKQFISTSIYTFLISQPVTFTIAAPATTLQL